MERRKPGRPKGPTDYLGRPARVVLVWNGTDGAGGHGPMLERFHDETHALGLAVSFARVSGGVSGLQALRRTVKGWERV